MRSFREIRGNLLRGRNAVTNRGSDFEPEYSGAQGYGTGNQGFYENDAPEYNNPQPFGRIESADHGRDPGFDFHQTPPPRNMQDLPRSTGESRSPAVRSWRRTREKVERHYGRLSEGARSHYSGRGYENYETYESGQFPQSRQRQWHDKEEPHLGRFGNSPTGYADPEEHYRTRHHRTENRERNIRNRNNQDLRNEHEDRFFTDYPYHWPQKDYTNKR